MNKLIFSMTNATQTQNGALSHKSTGSAVLDYYSKVGAMRGKDTLGLFTKAFNENAELTLRALFYTRDVRQGLGEREIFRATWRKLAKDVPTVFNRLLPLVPEYGRWDDILEFVDNTHVVALVKAQLLQDIDNDNPSILGKWMPSENASSEKTVALARRWIVALGLTAKEYRTMLTELRKRIGIVERAMSSGNWSEINYQRVTSKAMTNYRKAFSKHDAERFVQYLEDVKKGKSKINSKTLYPYEIVTKLGCDSYYGSSMMRLDPVLEEQWKALPDYMVGNENTLVVADVSGSMSGKPMSVALSLALYSAERNKGAFKNHFMVFSQRSEMMTVQGETLYEKFRNIIRAANGYMGNTNLQSVFDSILSHAVRYRVPESDMPTKLFIISDMQFDQATGANKHTNYEAIAQKYAQAGYKLPLIVFWNVNAYGDQPAMLNDYVFLVSGLTPVIFKYALQAKAISAYDQMVETLMSERYNAISAALKGIMK